VSSDNRAPAAAAQSIRAFYALGRASLRDRPARGGHGDRAAEAEAELAGMNPDLLRKARQFADAEAGYTRAELRALCDGVRTHFARFADRGTRVGRTHVVLLLRLPRGPGRDEVQAAMLEHGWSTAELATAIRRRVGRRRSGGRRPRVGADKAALLAELDGLCEQVTRMAAELARRAEAKERPSLADLSPKVREAVQQLADAAAGLRTAVGRCRPAGRKPDAG
jgi:hypothetical protein